MSKHERISAERSARGHFAGFLHKNRNLLIERWVQRVVNDPEIPAANKLSRPALEDDVPILVDLLIAKFARNPSQEVEHASEGDRASDVARSHTRHRLNAQYTVTEALRELSHLRRAVHALCDENFIVLGLDGVELLHATIDEWMAVTASELERAIVRSSEEIMAIVAHDLRNPLHVIAGYALLLQEGSPIDGLGVGVALERSVQQMQRLIEDLLAMSKLERGHLSIQRDRVDARALVKGVLEQLRRLADRKRITMSCAVPSQDVSIECDADRIEQALGNLISNAIKFTPEGGRVDVELELSTTHAIFCVRDTGPGISAEFRDRIFRPFWQGSNDARQGVGLGLAIARGIVEAHGGAIDVGSAPGGGTVFKFVIPLVEMARPSRSFFIERSK
ncbi:sensor histidine kinase [Pendulispora brunnea]|uniref:histidine kinase n=1 Tax=Pendulispora brunnea TaxID=2905690 RepID=A0ABZ2KBW8_9BACT